jgi:hypothetical protein
MPGTVSWPWLCVIFLFLFLACHKFHMMKKECISRWNLGVFRVQGPFVFVSFFMLFSALSRSCACTSVTTQLAAPVASTDLSDISLYIYIEYQKLQAYPVAIEYIFTSDIRFNHRISTSNLFSKFCERCSSRSIGWSIALYYIVLSYALSSCISRLPNGAASQFRASSRSIIALPPHHS